MKKLLISILLIASIIFASCSVQNNSASVEEKISKITLERYGMFTMPEYAFQKITISKTNITYETFNYDKNKTGETITLINESDFYTLVNVLNKNEFQSLNDEYNSDTPVADVGDGKITITYSNSEKIVEVAPYIQNGNPEEITEIMNVLQEIVNKAEFPKRDEPNLVTLKYEGKQCIDEPWDKWYSEGNINYFTAPTEDQLILDYYSNKGIGIYDIEKINNGIVCQACEVCASQYSFQVRIYETEVESFISDNWKIISE